MSGPEFSIPHREGSRATGLESSFAPFLPECFCWGYGGILLSAESSRSNRALNATKAGEGDGATGPSARIHLELFDYGSVIGGGTEHDVMR